MFKQVEKAISSQAVSCSKCILIANIKNSDCIVSLSSVSNIKKVCNELTSNTSNINNVNRNPKKSEANNNKLQEKRLKTFELIKKTSNQHGIKSELFDISLLNINFNNNLKGFSSNSSEFESFLSNLLL